MPRRRSGSRRTAPATRPRQRREIERRLIGGRAARRHRHRRARARDRHRLARLRDLGRLPRHGRRRCASSGDGPGAAGTGSPSSSRARTRSTSSSCASPRRCSRGRVEAAILDHANPRVLDGHVLSAAFEGADRRARRARRSGHEALERAAVLPELKRTPRGLGLGRDATTPRRACRSAPPTPDSFTVVDAETGAVLGLVERSARLLDRPRGRDLPPPRRAVPRALARPRRAHRASSRRSRGDWYTQAKKETQTAIVEPLRRSSAGSASSSPSAASR